MYDTADIDLLTEMSRWSNQDWLRNYQQHITEMLQPGGSDKSRAEAEETAFFNFMFEWLRLYPSARIGNALEWLTEIGILPPKNPSFGSQGLECSKGVACSTSKEGATDATPQLQQLP